MDIVEEIKKDICDNICKYSEKYENTEEEFDKLICEICPKCPLMKF